MKAILFRPPFRFIAAQIAALAIVVLTVRGFALPASYVLYMALGHAVAAIALTFAAGLRRWWLALALALPLMGWGGAALQVPSWGYLAIFAALFLVYWNAGRERVPLYLSNRTTWAALKELLDQETPPDGKRPAFADLGSGIGGTLAYLARNKREWDFVGVETAPVPFTVGALRVLPFGNATIRYRSLWDVDLGAFEVVYAFLSPAPMARLLDKARREMRPGTLFISNSFWADDQPFDAEIQVNDGRQTRLFLKRL